MDGKCVTVVFGLTDAAISAHAGVAITSVQMKGSKRAIPNQAFVNAMHEYQRAEGSADQCVDIDPEDDLEGDELEPNNSDVAMGDMEVDGVEYSDVDPGEETEVEQADELKDE